MRGLPSPLFSGVFFFNFNLQLELFKFHVTRNVFQPSLRFFKMFLITYQLNHYVSFRFFSHSYPNSAADIPACLPFDFNFKVDLLSLRSRSGTFLSRHNACMQQFLVLHHRRQQRFHFYFIIHLSLVGHLFILSLSIRAYLSTSSPPCLMASLARNIKLH